MSRVIVVCHCWCFPRCNFDHLLVLMFCGCGSHPEDLKEQNGIHSEHSCKGWIVVERHSETEKVWILPKICCTTFGLSVSKEHDHEEHYSKNEFIRF